MRQAVVRPMKPEDAYEAACLDQEIFTQPWSQQGFLNALTGRNLFLAAEKDSCIVGYCGMYCAADEGEIVNVAVKKEARREGIGEKMLLLLLEQAKTAGIHTVLLEVRVSNQAAIHLYEKLGFEICGLRKAFYEFPREDGYLMKLVF